MNDERMLLKTYYEKEHDQRIERFMMRAYEAMIK